MTVLFYTLGCKVNQYDTQALQELFIREGFAAAHKGGEPPDIVVINTCTVTAESDRKGRQAVRRFARTYPKAVIAVTGCMPQARAEKAQNLPDAHIIIGNALNEQLPSLIRQYLSDRRRIVEIRPHEAALSTDETCCESFEGRTRAFVKIEDGCNRFCSYCLIPYARGRVRSKPLPVLQQELLQLSEHGYKEVVLAGINLTAYGQDLCLSLCDAVEAAQAVPALQRIRLGSMEPDQLTPDMMERLVHCSKLCPQFHLSLQSGSDTVLARMNRHYDTAFYQTLIHSLQERFPGCAITTDIMCGFPGETEEEFQQTLAFIEQIGFARIHAFAYSPREGTPAAGWRNQIPAAIKARRMDALTAAARQTALAFMNRQKGTVQPVLLEQVKPGGMVEGHTPHYLSVQVKADSGLCGQIVPVLITDVKQEICIGELV